MMKKILGMVGIIGALVVSPVSAQAASLTFNPASGSLNKGCEVTIKVELDTQGVQTDGTDVIVIYTPAQLSISTSGITNGTIYPEYPGNSVDSAGGKISISGISSVSSPFTGTGTFATLKFKVADTATAGTPINLKFDFDPNNKTKTTDTNVVERGTIADVLSAVTDGAYTVGTGSCASGIQASPSPVSRSTGSGVNGQGQYLADGSLVGSQSAQYPVVRPTLGQVVGGDAGILDNTLVIASVGIILVILGVAGLAML